MQGRMSAQHTGRGLWSLFRPRPLVAPALPAKEALEIMVTLWPSFPHFHRFASDGRLAGIRLNSAMIGVPDLERELALLPEKNAVPLYFDVKGRQLRITEVHENPECLDISLNHPIQVQTPTTVLFKAGADHALLLDVTEGGYRLKFHQGPKFMVRVGESLHLRHPSLRVGGEQFVPAELEKIARVKAAGFSRYFLSYVQSARDVDEFRELVGRDAEIFLKIENQKGLDYVAREFEKCDNLKLVAAQGDLYVELERPHQILSALKLIIDKDPQACVGSRMMLSIMQEPVPSCADFEQVAWLYDRGYRNMMLCDEICLKEDLLSASVNALDAFRQDYA
ncbi:MAG: pyruvate kinase [Patescibacteria group bacterium]